MKEKMTSMERVLSTLGHREPDRVPKFLLLTMHGARELGLSIREYFSKAEFVAEGQISMRKKYRNDCLYAFFYAPIEVEAFGGEVLYCDDGPPNAGSPVITKVETIRQLQPPVVSQSPVLKKVLKSIEIMKEKVGQEAPIIGVVMSPFSLPVMQLGFDKYLELMYFRQDLFENLMRINEAFCIDWANAQLQAGATAICYFDPVSSTTIITREQYQRTGFQVAQNTLSRINGPTATHFASGRCLPIVDDIAQTGTAVIGISAMEELYALKHACQNRLTLLGNLNGIEMRNWSQQETETKVRNVLEVAAPGGGFILSDNHGEIPFQVPDDVLLAVSEAVHEFGRYPVRS